MIRLDTAHRIPLLLSALILIGSANCNSSEIINTDALDHPETIVANAVGWTPKFQVYQEELLSLALEASRDEFGPYKLSYFRNEMSANRLRSSIAQGKLVHIDFVTEKEMPDDIRKGTHVSEYDLYQGLLGLRRLIIRHKDVDVFKNISNLRDFRQLSVGQGAGWADNRVYQAHNIDLITSIKNSHLVSMLAASRFDYLAFSVLEIESALKDDGTDISTLAICEDVYIYYPIPTYLMISARYPVLVKRVHRGLELLEKNGTVDELFNRYFGKNLEKIKSENSTVIILNPKLQDGTASELEKIFGRYFSEKTRTIHSY
ncbi:MAG: hypothetical protein ACI93R_001697 [Flavobacteriales bacterium]|jgi:hypothetical protein